MFIVSCCGHLRLNRKTNKLGRLRRLVSTGTARQKKCNRNKNYFRSAGSVGLHYWPSDVVGMPCKFCLCTFYENFALRDRTAAAHQLFAIIGVARGCTRCTCPPGRRKKFGAKFTGESCKCIPRKSKSLFFRKLGRSGRWEWLIY